LGLRESSIKSTQSLSGDDQETWRQLRRDLEDIGIPITVLREKRQFIIAWCQKAILSGALDETKDDQVFVGEASNTPPASGSQPLQQNDAMITMSTPASSTPCLHSSTPQTETISQELRRVIKSSTDFEALRLLLDTGIDVNTPLSKGMTALHHSAQKPMMVSVLLERGANPNIKSHSGWTPLHFASGLSSAEAMDVVRLLLEHGADTEIASERDGWTALQHACRWSHSHGILRLLLQHGANIHAIDRSGWTALHLASRYSGVANQNNLRVLLENDADLKATATGGITALHLASGYGKLSTVWLLLRYGADVNARTDKGSTALHLAVRRFGNSTDLLRRTDLLELVRKLVLFGSNTASKNNSGETPKDLASKLDDNDLIKALEEL
jgi:ankyrin repeat protein